MRRWSHLSLMLCVLVAGIAVLPAPARAWQAFAKVSTSTGSIDGDATFKSFEKQIVVLGLGNTIDRIAVVAGETPRLRLRPIQLVKAFDVATPKLVAAVATGQVLTKVEITLFKKSPTGSEPGFKITLTNATITQVETVFDPGATPSTLEKVEITYQTLQWMDIATGVTGSAP